ncbi:TIGR00725 family protein [Halorubrum vacuolatum]|uniref:TIGR00725 family protein n=1 Tax=Halorubrum vacuolatum TaxID=63740 RepID=A0A238VCL3_HALVU|nr:TIGR00725 family protein [Halorubrum vacuolatum]SNR32132.1 hypothetical protein SAMN06264855_102271 [Halorubrum vacuolatum]
MRVSVIGGSTASAEIEAIAERLGRLLADRGHTVVCGGLGGVMTAVCRGAASSNGRTIGILPTDRLADANEYVTVPIATGLGHARNALVVMNGEAVIAVDGGPGTLSEIGLALAFARPVAGLDTHDVTGVVAVEDPEAAVAYVEGTVE